MDVRHLGASIGGRRCPARRCSTCTDISEPAKQELGRLARIRIYRAGETVIAEQDEIVFVGTVLSGVLRLQKTLHDGRQQIVGLLVPGDMVGRVFSSNSHVAIEAAADTTLCCYSRGNFEILLGRFPELEHRMLVAMSHELDAAQDWMLLLATQNVTERVATFLLLMRRASPSDLPVMTRISHVVEVPISRKDMAAYLGTTVESISRSIQQMVRSGVIRIIDPQHIEVVHASRLIDLSGHDPSEFDPPRTDIRRAG